MFLYMQINNLIGNYRFWTAETNPEILQSELANILDKAGYTILNFVEHHFTPHGYTCLWLLGESHLAVHTFPEKQASYIEMSGCNKEMNEDFIHQVHQAFSSILVEEETAII